MMFLNFLIFQNLTILVGHREYDFSDYITEVSPFLC